MAARYVIIPIFVLKFNSVVMQTVLVVLTGGWNMTLGKYKNYEYVCVYLFVHSRFFHHTYDERRNIGTK